MTLRPMVLAGRGADVDRPGRHDAAPARVPPAGDPGQPWAVEPFRCRLVYWYGEPPMKFTLSGV